MKNIPAFSNFSHHATVVGKDISHPFAISKIQSAPIVRKLDTFFECVIHKAGNLGISVVAMDAKEGE